MAKTPLRGRHSGAIYLGQFKADRVLFEPAERRFWVRNAHGEAVFISSSGVRRHLMALGFSSRVARCAELSPLELRLHDIEINHRIDSVVWSKTELVLCPGMWIHQGQRILVLEAPRHVR